MIESGQKIMALRLHLGLSKAEFAKRIGYSSTHIARLEQGISIPKNELIETMCNVFRVDVRYFTGELCLEDALNPVNDSVTRERQEPDGKASERIKQMREERGISQRKFARLAGVDSSMISQVEAGERKLTKNAAEKISQAFEVGAEWLLFGDESRKDYPVNDRMIEWLWRHKGKRKELWALINEE